VCKSKPPEFPIDFRIWARRAARRSAAHDARIGQKLAAQVAQSFMDQAIAARPEGRPLAEVLIRERDGANVMFFAEPLTQSVC